MAILPTNPTYDTPERAAARKEAQSTPEAKRKAAAQRAAAARIWQRKLSRGTR